MISLFADTSYYIELLLKSDQAHARVIAFTEGLDAKIFTTAWVLTEVANALSARRFRSEFLSLLDDLEANQNVLIVGPDPQIFRRGLELYRSRADKDWSLTDCISFIVMNREGLTEALTADRHFDQAGFKALLK
jgi:predicted nucleic acid-binding protein